MDWWKQWDWPLDPADDQKKNRRNFLLRRPRGVAHNSGALEGSAPCYAAKHWIRYGETADPKPYDRSDCPGSHLGVSELDYFWLGSDVDHGWPRCGLIGADRPDPE